MILSRHWIPRHEPILRIERTLAALFTRPSRPSIITKTHTRRGHQTRRNQAAAKQLLEKLGL